MSRMPRKSRVNMPSRKASTVRFCGPRELRAIPAARRSAGTKVPSVMRRPPSLVLRAMMIAWMKRKTASWKSASQSDIPAATAHTIMTMKENARPKTAVR